MSLYDVIDTISERKASQTETGDTRVYGVMLGAVAKNYDKDMPGRVCVAVPTRAKEKNELKWARPAWLSGGERWGSYFLPEVGDQVLLAFENGNIEKPYIIGCVLKDSSKFLGDAADENNQIKRIKTKNGSAVTFFDNKEGDGEKDSILVETAGKAHSVLLDNDKKRITLTDKAKENYIEIRTDDGNGQMTIKAKSRLTIEVGENITLTLNGDSGAVSLKASEFSAKVSGFKVQSNGTVKVEGATMSLNASSKLSAESSGIVTVAGAPIKIG